MEKRIAPATFRFKSFSRRQKQLLTWWMPQSGVSNWNGIIADGAIRSGKTVAMSLSFVMWAMHTFQAQNFAMCGKTIGSFRRNVLFGLKQMLGSRGYLVEDQRTDNLLVVARGDTINYFYLFGGKDERSEELIQGITLAGIFFDEVALMPESFVNQGTGRCSVAGSKFWFNCNPEGPLHWFKRGWIDQCREKRLLYLHFTMEDNLSLAEEIKARYRSMYVGVFFQRFILGLWRAAEGLIYDMYDEKLNGCGDKDLPGSYSRYIAVDYGTANPFAALDIRDDGHTIFVAKEYYWDSKERQRQLEDSQYADAVEALIGQEQEDGVIVDPSAASFRATMRNRGHVVTDADNAVEDGIRRVATLIAHRRIRIHTSCTNIRRELSSYAWDAKAAERGVEKPEKVNDHALDALRYYVKTKVKNWRLTDE